MAALLKCAAGSLCNWMLKNYKSECNDELHKKRKRDDSKRRRGAKEKESPSERKVRKLQSDS